jgi:hypothetical protein
MRKKRDPIVRAATADGQRAGEALVETIENQLRLNDPPETRETLERLMTLGETRDNAMRYIGCVLATEIFYIFKNKDTFNRERYVHNLKELPKLPDD